MLLLGLRRVAALLPPPPLLLPPTPKPPHQYVVACADAAGPTAAAAPPMRVIDAAAIIGGTSVGGSFLALPMVTAPLGLGPSLVGMFAAWAVLAASAIAYLEAAAIVMEREGEAEGASVVAVSRHAFGGAAATVVSSLFLVQCVVVIAAQLAKAGELLSLLAPVAAAAAPAAYPAACVATAALSAAAVFGAHRALVERLNTGLAATLIVGLLWLSGRALGGALPSGAAAASRLGGADWSALLPGTAAAGWPIPLFLKLLSFGQAVPVVAAGLGPRRLGAARAAVLAGSAVPLLLSAMWATVSALLASAGAGASADPTVQLLGAGWASALPAVAVASGAIGTSLIANYLTVRQFCADALRALQGRGAGAPPVGVPVAVLAALSLPAAIACGGARLYLPLLRWSGAFPTTILYGLLPPLAALALGRQRGGSSARASRLALRAHAALTAALLGVNLALASNVRGCWRLGGLLR
mmetsp:Transcript_10372/g.33311  ORF Transcript_10372/g.33311 Transcript_10372/m.33311 type:complete len:470 (+) Transcript_10372:3-1412(+)